MVLPKSNSPEVYVDTTTNIISDSYNDLKDTLNHLKNLKPKIYLGENIVDLCDALLVDAGLIWEKLSL